MKRTTQQCLAAALALTVSFALPALAHPQQEPGQDPAIENQPAGADEPSIDELLGLEEEDAGESEKPADPDTDTGEDQTDPELSRELDKALSGEQAADQFAQAIEEMEEVAIRLGEESDPGIDTQRLQDEIILKLEQIIASAQKSPNQQQQQQGQGKPQKPREADRQQGQEQQQPGEQQPGEEQGQEPGQQPGEQQGQQPGDQPGQGEQQGNQPGQQADGQQSGQTGSRGNVRNEELSMQDLREGEWGNLPPRLRDELAESLSETFNPVYRAATEAFYRRIAELSQQQAQEEGGE